MTTKTEMKAAPTPGEMLEAAEILKKAKALFGANGDKWVQEYFYLDGSYCAMGATRQAAVGDAESFGCDEEIDGAVALFGDDVVPRPLYIAEKALQKAFRRKNIADYNDKDGRTFKDIASGFDRAIESLSTLTYPEMPKKEAKATV